LCDELEDAKDPPKSAGTALDSPLVKWLRAAYEVGYRDGQDANK
jgi:hypothetical protein